MSRSYDRSTDLPGMLPGFRECSDGADRRSIIEALSAALHLETTLSLTVPTLHNARREALLAEALRIELMEAMHSWGISFADARAA